MTLTVELILVLAVVIFGAVNGLVMFRDSVNRALFSHARTLDEITQIASRNAITSISGTQAESVSAAKMAAEQRVSQGNSQSVSVTVYAGGQGVGDVPPSP